MTQVYLIYGAPLSGKSTYVKQRLKHNDVVFDYDDIMRTITGLPYQTNNKRVQPIVLGLRSLIIEHIKTNPTIDNVYIITTFIGKSLEQSLNGLNLNKIRMDTTYMECIERLQESNRADKEDVRFTIVDWFNKHFNHGITKEQYGTEQNKKRFYTGPKWYKGTREAVLERDNYECQLCKREGKVTTDSIKQHGIKKKPTLNVHHIMELEYYPEHAYDMENLITVCIACHNKIHNRHECQFKRSQNKWADDEMW